MAIFFALLLWLVVVNIDDPIDTQIFRNIPVVVQNEEVVTNMGKTYQIVDNTQAVSVTVSAKRSILAKIASSDIIASANMSEMELMSLVPITVSIQGFEGRYASATANPHNLQVNVEDITKNTFPLKVSTTGTLRDGYVLGTMKTNPETVTIGGSESRIANIDSAVAKIDISGLGADDTIKADLILYDATGNVIDATMLTNNLGEKGVSVDVQVLNTKNLTVQAEVTGEPADGYVYTGLVYEPESVQVSGTEEELADIETIKIPGSAVNITGLTGKQEYVVDVSKYLPEGVQLTDDAAKNVILTVTVEPAGTKTIELPVESITVSNLTDKLKLEYVTMDNLQLQFQGAQENLDNLNVKSAAFIDLRNYTTTGTYEVPVRIEVPTGVTLVSEPMVKVQLMEKKD